MAATGKKNREDLIVRTETTGTTDHQDYGTGLVARQEWVEGLPCIIFAYIQLLPLETAPCLAAS